MSQKPLWRRYLRIFGPDVGADVDEEIRFHLEMRTEELIAEGWSPEAARQEAGRLFGDMGKVVSECRRVGQRRLRAKRRSSFLNEVWRDLAFSVRIAVAHPLLSIVIIGSLAIGIGTNTAVFSTINAALIRDIPFDDPDRLIAGEKTIDGTLKGAVSRLDYFDLRDSTEAFEGLAVYAPLQATVTGEAPPEVVGVVYSSWNLFHVLGVEPVVGRRFVPEEEAEGGSDSVLISHRMWQRRFGGAQEVAGATIHLNGEPRTIIGVIPAAFLFMSDADVWAPIERGDFFLDQGRGSHSLLMVGRLKSGVSRVQAQSEVDAVAADLEAQYPDTNNGKGLALFDLQMYMLGEARLSFFLLMAATILVLLIACSNVAALLLARGQGRLQEMAMRSALGAPKQRLVRQLVVESTFMTLVAGAIGIGLAAGFQRLILRLIPTGRPGLPEPSLDGTVMLFTLLISLLVGTIVGGIPALRVTSISPWVHLKTASLTSEDKGSSRVRNLLVVSQVAISIVLLVGSGLLIQTMDNLTTVSLGFEPTNLLAGTVEIRASAYETREQRRDFFSSLVEQVGALPQVVMASTISRLPIASPEMNWLVWPADQPRPVSGTGHTALARFATPGYFETMGIPILKGRGIVKSDDPDVARIMVVSEALADHLFPDSDPMDQLVNLGWNDPYQIVGVVGNAKLNGVRSNFDGAMYMSAAQVGSTSQWLVARTAGDPNLVSDSIRQLLHELDREVVFSNPRTMASIVSSNLTGVRSVTLALSILAGIALLLTSIGIYGVLAYNVNQRKGEFGLRTALGAQTRELLVMAVARGLRLVAAGIVFGVILSIFGTRVLQSLLYQTDPMDPVVILGATVFLGVIALVACLVPAWRAVRVEPVEVLRRN